MAGKLNLLIEQGATFKYKLTWKASGGKLVNLTGWNARLQIRKSADSPDVVLELSTFNGRISLGGSTGTISLSIPDEVTQGLIPDTYVYDLLMDAPDGTRDRLVEGKVTVSPGVTHD